MKKPIILVTSPSIDINENVSGIANLTRLWVESNSKVTYLIFTVGKKDVENKNLGWFIKQVVIVFSFLKVLVGKQINMIHINMPLGKTSSIRDSVFGLISFLTRKKYIVHIRGGRYSNNENTPWILKKIISISLKKSVSIIVLGEKEKMFISEYYKIPATKIVILPNCVKINLDRPKESYGIPINLLYMGRLDKNKGLNEIVLALSELSIAYKLHIAGEGPDKDWFLNECQMYLRDNYIYHGVVFGELKHKLLLHCDIFLLPSYFEGLPNALLEAMSYGIVPIVTPVGSIPEVVTHKENGLFVSIGKHLELKNAIESIYKDVNLFGELSIHAYNTIKENYSHQDYIKNLNEIYLNIRQ